MRATALYITSHRLSAGHVHAGALCENLECKTGLAYHVLTIQDDYGMQRWYVCKECEEAANVIIKATLEFQR